MAAVQGAIDEFASAGGIDILVNNAIIPHSPPVSSQAAPLLEVTEETWEGLVSVGLKGYFFACQRAAKHMVEQKRGGCLVCLSSVHAVNPCSDWTVYGSCAQAGTCRLARRDWPASVAGPCLNSTAVCAGKAALERMVKGLACDLRGHGISANCIAPGVKP